MIRLSVRINRIIFLFLSILLYFGSLPVFASESIIIVDTQGNRGAVNKMIFGNNFIAYDPNTYENWGRPYYGYSDFGAGIWDPKWNKSIKDVLDLAQAVGISIARFPGGAGSKGYDWKQAVGVKRPQFLFGIDEFIKVNNSIRSESIITLSYFTGDDKTDADLVEYLNSPNDGSNPNGGTDWAAVRAQNGHPQPYKVKYFEVGNEVYLGYHDRKVSAKEYAIRYLSYYEALKRVDPLVQIGLVLYDASWNREVLDIVKDKVDFGIIHTYPTPVWGKSLEQFPARSIYEISFAKAILEHGEFYQDTLKLLKGNAGKNVPLAITEYNGGFVQDKPVPYRHALGTALLNAELLRIFMKQENNILMANYWNFNNSYTGMIANGFDGTQKTLYNPYYKRPNYYVFEIYHKHFGDILVGVEVQSDTYDVGQYESFKSRIKNLIKGEAGQKQTQIPYLSVNASKSADGKKMYLMVINKNMDESMPTTIELKDFVPASEANAWILNGPSIDATNEKKHDNVKVTHKQFKVQGSRFKDQGQVAESQPATSNLQPTTTFEYTFEPHSLTAIEIERVEK